MLVYLRDGSAWRIVHLRDRSETIVRVVILG